MQDIQPAQRTIDGAALDRIFNKARTHNGWAPTPVGDALLRAVWDVARMGPTSANCQPLRVVFVATPEGKERLKPALMEGNVVKTMAAPVCAIFAHDLEFYELLPELFPHTDAKSWFTGEGKAEFVQDTAFRNGTLQAAYFMIAARALGLDCGPMSGFDQDKVDAEFFAGTKVKSNFLCNLGIGTEDDLFPRAPRLDFDRACQIA